MRKKSVKRGVWYMGGRKKRRQKGGAFPFVVLAAPTLGNLGGIILKILIGGGRRKQKYRQRFD